MNEPVIPLKIAIVGRPNVGKSTLFNRLLGKRLALVNDQPGVTRDRRKASASLGGRAFEVIDTAGLEDAKEGLEGMMRLQTEHALNEADLAFFVIDARVGVTPLDKHFANFLRKHPVPVILLANKCEGRQGDGGLMESYSLGLGEPIALSAEHGDGTWDLHQALTPYFIAHDEKHAHTQARSGLHECAEETQDTEEPFDRRLHIAIVGRPNVGKSTLINQLLGEERVLSSAIAGTTRDTISCDWQWRNREIRLFDTAGLRRRARVQGKLERLSVQDTKRAINFAQVVVVLLDLTQGLEKQDLTIAHEVLEEGRALVIGANKADAVRHQKTAIRAIRDRLEISLFQARGVPVIPLSAKTGKGVEKLLEATSAIERVWSTRVPTGELNRWLSMMSEAHPPPVINGRHIRLRYITQAKVRPPTFAVFSSRADRMPEHYARYMVNGLREDFGLRGVPIRLHFRKGNNPYDS